MKTTDRRAEYYELVRLYTNGAKWSVPGRKPGDSIDHIIPVSFGFKYGISAHMIGCVQNLQWLNNYENCAKSDRLDSGTVSKLIELGYPEIAEVVQIKINR